MAGCCPPQHFGFHLLHWMMAALSKWGEASPIAAAWIEESLSCHYYSWLFKNTFNPLCSGPAVTAKSRRYVHVLRRPVTVLLCNLQKDEGSACLPDMKTWTCMGVVVCACLRRVPGWCLIYLLVIEVMDLKREFCSFFTHFISCQGAHQAWFLVPTSTEVGQQMSFVT